MLWPSQALRFSLDVGVRPFSCSIGRPAGGDFLAELATLTGMACLFSNNFAYQGGEYGHALLTRFPVRRWTNTHLRMLRAGE